MINAKEFYRRFVEATREDNIAPDGRTYLEVYKVDADYTKLVNGPIISDLIKGIDPRMEVQHEYFRIDSVGWISHYEEMKEEAQKAGLKVNAHLWDLKVAVEHENSKADWSDEVMKLIHVKCPLKVIIGYSYSDERDDVELRKLDFVAEWMQKIDALQKGTDEEYLVILGNGCNRKTGESDYDRFDYRGYLYSFDTKRFERIVPEA